MTGQVVSDSIGTRMYSGVGGQVTSLSYAMLVFSSNCLKPSPWCLCCCCSSSSSCSSCCCCCFLYYSRCFMLLIRLLIIYVYDCCRKTVISRESAVLRVYNVYARVRKPTRKIAQCFCCSRNFKDCLRWEMPPYTLEIPTFARTGVMVFHPLYKRLSIFSVSVLGAVRTLAVSRMPW